MKFPNKGIITITPNSTMHHNQYLIMKLPKHHTKSFSLPRVILQPTKKLAIKPAGKVQNQQSSTEKVIIKA